MPEIKRLVAREILDSRGNPTVEVELFTEKFSVRAAVPSGASTGSHEALELRDKGKRYHGQGVLKALGNIDRKIAPTVVGLDTSQQKLIDMQMGIMDGTQNKSYLGANATLAVSMAVCRAGARAMGIPLYNYIAEIYGTKKIRLPVPYFNVINGGKHAGNSLDFQEFMIVPTGARSFREALRMGSETYHTLKGLIREQYGLSSINVGDEGGFAPPVENNEAPLRLLVKAIDKAGYKDQVKIAMDVASSEFFHDGKYLLGKKDADEKSIKRMAQNEGLSGKQLAQQYKRWIAKYPIISIEDPFAEDDWEAWSEFTKMAGVQVVGDDLLVTNVERIKLALEKKACNALLLKVNQIGTVTEAINAAKMAHINGWKVMVSHRSGETEDTFIADLAVGLGTGQIKSGAPCRGERTAKYNQLLRIEEML